MLKLMATLLPGALPASDQGDPLEWIVKEKVRAAQAEGRTVVVTSHNLGDLETVADSVAFLLDGRVRFDGSLEHLLDVTGQSDLEHAIAELMRGDRLHPEATSRETAGDPPARMEIVR